MRPTEPGAPASPDRRLTRNTLWNCLGLLAPLPVGLLVIPFLAHRLGADRFGVLALSWTMIGYFALFDLGLGRAVIKLAAEKSGGGQGHRGWNGLYWTAMSLLLVLGLLAGLAVAAVSIWLVNRGLRIPEGLRSEALAAFLLLALATPALMLVSVPMGFLSTLGRFDVLNLIRLPTTLLLFVGPAAVALVSVRLPAVVGILVASRYIALGMNLLWCHRLCPSLSGRPRFDRALVGPLLRFGGWLTVAHVISPLMVTLDRFLVGILASTSQVAYYATPGEALLRIWGLPAAVVGVLYPAFAATLGRDPGRAAALYERGVRALFLVLFPLLLAVVLFAPEGLGLWLGAEYRAHSARVLQLIAIGVFANGLNHVPAELINAAGRPAFTAKLRLLEVIPYLLAAYLLIVRLGIEGAALAWMLRLLVDAWVLAACADRILREAGAAGRRSLVAGALGVAALTIGVAIGPLPWRVIYFASAVAVTVYLVVFLWLDAADRAALGQAFRKALRWQTED